MPIFFQQDIDANTKLGIWNIEEEEEFFLQKVMPQRNVSHPHKKLQHLAGRYLLKFLFPQFPVSLIQIADTRKPFLEDEAYHFSISHCGDYAAAIVSKTKRVGLDIEIPTNKTLKILHKFLHPDERIMLDQWEKEQNSELPTPNFLLSTLLWSAKEAMFKWWGHGHIEFSEMLRVSGTAPQEEGQLHARFVKDAIQVSFDLNYKIFRDILLTWVDTEPGLLQINSSRRL